MRKLFENLNKLSLPATIIIASLILGGFYYISQVSKHVLLRDSNRLKLRQKKQAKEEAQQALNTCLEQVKKKYGDVLEGGLKYCNKHPTYNCGGQVIDAVNTAIKEESAECFKRYPQK